MSEINIQELIDTNHKILALLGMATALICGHNKNEYDRKWFLHAVNEVIYLKNSIPEPPDRIDHAISQRKGRKIT